jgi:hypothetical protein
MVVCGIRGIIMVVELNEGYVNLKICLLYSLLNHLPSQSNIAWECDNGGQLWTPSAEAGYQPSVAFPSAFCTSGFASINTAFCVSLVIDLACQVNNHFIHTPGLNESNGSRSMPDLHVLYDLEILADVCTL